MSFHEEIGQAAFLQIPKETIHTIKTYIVRQGIMGLNPSTTQYLNSALHVSTE